MTWATSVCAWQGLLTITSQNTVTTSSDYHTLGSHREGGVTVLFTISTWLSICRFHLRHKVVRIRGMCVCVTRHITTKAYQHTHEFILMCDKMLIHSTHVWQAKCWSTLVVMCCVTHTHIPLILTLPKRISTHMSLYSCVTKYWSTLVVNDVSCRTHTFIWFLQISVSSEQSNV